MDCGRVRENLADLLLAPESVTAEARAHVDSCAECGQELRELEATMAALDLWEAPEVSPYFDGKMAVRLREEREAAPAGWLERMRQRLMFGNHMSLRPALAAALAVMVAVGGGMYVGFSGQPGQPAHPAPMASASPVIQDLQSLDENQEVFQQLSSMDQQDAGNSGNGSGSAGGNSL